MPGGSGEKTCLCQTGVDTARRALDGGAAAGCFHFLTFFHFFTSLSLYLLYHLCYNAAIPIHRPKPHSAKIDPRFWTSSLGECSLAAHHLFGALLSMCDSAGNADASTTLNLYAGALPDNDARAAEAIGGILSAPRE